MKVLLAGSTGLIGSAVAQRLQPDHALTTLGRQADLVSVTADLSDPVRLADLQLPAADCLVHCAGVIDEDFRSDPAAAYRRATLGAEALLNAASEAGCERFIYLSSTHVYGPQEGTKAEDSPVDPRSHYALSHYCTEQIFRAHAAKVQGSYVVLRPNAVYGLPAHPESFQRWSLIPFSFPREAKETGCITLKSSGLQTRNFVSTGAIADMVSRCVGGDLAEADGVMHVLGVETESVYDFAQRCRKIAEEQLGRLCTVERPATSLEAANAAAGSDFALVSQYHQQRPADELNNFLRQFISIC
jgi:UDP-glucose 4-epimerase